MVQVHVGPQFNYLGNTGKRPRDEYVLTGKGTELVDLLMVMVTWGDRWADDGTGPHSPIPHRACGEISHVELSCAHCGTIMRAGDVDLLDGPGAASAYEGRR